MFISMEKLKRAIKDVLDGPAVSEAKDLRKEITKLKNEIEDLQLKKRIEEAEIKHLVKMKEEKNAIELEKQTAAVKAEYAQKEMDLLKKYQQDLTGRFVEEQKNLQAVYAEIMKRLPNVNMEISKKA